MIAVLALLIGVCAGLAAGGSIQGISRLRLRGEFAILATFVIQGIARGRVAGATATTVAMDVWVAASLVLVGLLLMNFEYPGVLLTAVGTLLNLIVVLANGSMPVLPSSDLHVQQARLSAASGGFYGLVHPGTLAVWGGDVLRLAFFDQRYFLSVGDLLLAVGVAVIVADAMMAPAEHPSEDDPVLLRAQQLP